MATTLPLVEARPFIGRGARWLIERGVSAAGALLPAERVPDLFDRFIAHYNAHIADQSRPFPGMVEALGRLRESGARLAVCTNKPQRFIRPLLQALALEDYFECIVGGDTLPERKPSAMPLLHLVGHFGFSPAQCLMVGDSETDLLTAQAAGVSMALVTYGYLRGFDPHSVQGVRVMDDLRELLR